MAILQIEPESYSLRKNCSLIQKASQELKDLSQSMIETMQAHNGVGLAANQINILKRIIVILNPETQEIETYINPRILTKSNETSTALEGCLSFPNLQGEVERAYKVTILAYDIDMKKVHITAQGFYARIFQHEIDHLNGISFTKRANKNTLITIDTTQE